MPETLTDDALLTAYRQRRTRHLLEHTPDLIVYLLADITPCKTASRVRVDESAKQPLPINADALDTANHTYGQLVDWATNHARTLNITPPITVLAWYTKDADCNGFPTWASDPHTAHSLTKDVTDWLTAYGRAIATTDAAEAYWEDIRKLIQPLQARYRPKVRTGAPASEDCPACGRRTVIVDDEGGEIVVACTYCGLVIPHQFRAKYMQWKLEDELARA